MGRRSRKLSTYDWVFLDLDGTLVDSLPVMRTVYNDFLGRFGRVGTTSEFEVMNGYSLREIAAHLKDAHRLEEEVAELTSRYRDLIATTYASTPPVDGAVELLEALRDSGVSLALVTAGDVGPASELLRRLGWTGYFAVTVFGNEVAAGKPAPDIYQLALERAGAEVDAVVVEDSRHGADSARAAGLEVVVLGRDVSTLRECLQWV